MFFFFMFGTVVSTFFLLQIPPLVPNIFSFFSSHQGAVFFFFLFISLCLSILHWRYKKGNFFLTYQLIWIFLKILFRSFLFSPIPSVTSSLVNLSDYLIFSILLQHLISRLSVYFRSKFLIAEVSEPYKAML